MVRKFYQVKWNLKSGYWHEPLTAGEVLQLPPDVAEALNRCSPGVLVEFDPRPPVQVSAPAAPEHRSAPVFAPRTADPVVERGPGRPPKPREDS